ncbi:MAG: ATP-binding cassette domain-containing protein [Pseudomonadota bacterium]
MPEDSIRTNRGLEALNLCVQRSETSLLSGVTVSLPVTGVSVIMGPNGAGKSLFLRALHGLVEPTSGAIKYPDDHDRARESMVFQKPVLLRRSVGSNIRFSARQRKDASPVDLFRLLHRVGLEGRERQPADALSGGERQRLALACALARRPDLLFLDEPTANLDPASTARIEAVVGETAADGTKIIFVTHDIGQARRLADDVLFFHKGRLEEHTPAYDFFDRPRSSAARAFLAGELLTG